MMAVLLACMATLGISTDTCVLTRSLCSGLMWSDRLPLLARGSVNDSLISAVLVSSVSRLAGSLGTH